MLDFPNTPTDGQRHTEAGTIWQWQADPGLWKVVQSGTPLEIVEADTSAGWQVWGDVLVQWGEATGSAGPLTVPFPTAFKTEPMIAAVVHTNTSTTTTTLYSASTMNVTTTQFDIMRMAVGTGAATTTGFGARWIAIGEAPDNLKKPKTVQTIGGSVLQEFHDPTGVASWRIVGTTLECWGVTASPGAQTVSFPKTFAGVPEVTATGRSGSPRIVSVANETTTSFDGVIFDASGAPANGNTFAWRAIGEWDGVS